MEGDFFQNLGELGASIKRYIDGEIERRMREERELYARHLDEDEPYELSPQQLADTLPMRISRDTIMDYVHSGVLRGCFIITNSHYKFKRRASKHAIEAYSRSKIYGDDSLNDAPAMPQQKPAATGGRPRTAKKAGNLRQMPGRSST